MPHPIQYPPLPDNFVEQRVIRHPGMYVAGPDRIIGALCEDGKQRVARCSAKGADTYFSIPARIKVRGKTVTGFLTCDTDYCRHCGHQLYSHGVVRGLECPDQEDRMILRRQKFEALPQGYVWRFFANRYGKNANLVKQGDTNAA